MRKVWINVEVSSCKSLKNYPGETLWRLHIQGDVQKPMTLKLSELMALAQVSQTCDVHCVTGWTLLDSQWQGIRMKTIMDLVKVKDRARFVILEAPGDYTSNIPIQEARKENVLLAHGFSGQELPQEHGAPLRALVPDRYFYKSVKWLRRIIFSSVDVPGYYERIKIPELQKPQGFRGKASRVTL